MRIEFLNSLNRGLIRRGVKRLTACLLVLVLPSLGVNVATAQAVKGPKFPQDDNAGTRVCSALGLSDSKPDVVVYRTTDVLGRVSSVRVQANGNWPVSTPPCTPLKRMALTAAEAIMGATERTKNYTFDDAVKAIQSDGTIRNQVVGALATLMTDSIVKNEPDPQLREWATNVYRKNTILAAKGSLDEYQKWKKDPCGYQAEGYVKPQACAKSVANYYDTSIRPPSDLIGKAGLRAALGDDVAIANAVATGLSAVLYTVANVAILSAIGYSSSFTGGTIITSLFFSFGGGAAGTIVGTLNGGMTVGSLGATGWTGVAAGPVAAIVFALTIGITKGLEIFENAAVEPNLKRALGAAISQNIAIRNALKDDSGASLFIAGVISAAQDPGWQVMQPNLDGEVTFRCEAGYYSKFTLSYTDRSGGTVVKTTANMPVGVQESFPIPHEATNIVAKGFMISAGEHEVFTQKIPTPTYTCFKTFNTIFNPSWANAWTLKTPGKIKLFHQGGYVEKYQIDYKLGSMPAQPTTTGEKPAGWTQTFNVPENATEVRIRGWGATGLAWEPWRLTFDKTYPEAPGVCIKTYGTTLDQKWATDCQI